jgi:hypothetical protein
LNDEVERILDRLDGVTTSGTGWAARCPAHDDSSPSLSLGEGESGGLVIHCHAGCEPEAIMQAIGLTMADLMGKPRIVATYDYKDDEGNVLYSIERWQPKDFRTNPAGIKPAERTLFARPAIRWARENNKPIYVVEGEKDAICLLEKGYAATCNPHGAGKWMPHYSELLAGCEVVIVADNDDKGVTHARDVFKSVEGVAKSARLARPTHGKDVSDLFAAGFGLTHLEPVPERPGLQTFRADQVVPKKVTWAWERYVPFGAMTLIDGDPAAGKSTLTMDLASRWSTGAAMPDGAPSGGPFDVVMISAEDDPEYTLAPRLMGAGARLDKVHLVTGGMREESSFNLGVDLYALEQLIVDTGARILTLDPLAAFLPGGMDARMDAEVRQSLQPIIHLARRLSVALLVVRHLTKSQTKAMYAGGGSVGFIAAARAAFLVSNDPSSGDSHKVIAPIKTNLTRMPEALAYSIESSHHDTDVPYIQWHGQVPWEAQQLLDGKSAEEERSKRVAARGYLYSMLEKTAAPGMTWKDIVGRGRDDGYSQRTLERARDALGESGEITHEINPRSETGLTHLGTYWRLTAEVSAQPMPEQAVEHPVAPPTENEARVAEFNAKPKVCDVCGSEEYVMRWAEPWWAVRCRAHNPEFFNGGE